MTKRMIAVLCAFMMMLSLAACGGNGGSADSGADSPEEALEKAYQALHADKDAEKYVPYIYPYQFRTNKKSSDYVEIEQKRMDNGAVYAGWEKKFGEGYTVKVADILTTPCTDEEAQLYRDRMEQQNIKTDGIEEMLKLNYHLTVSGPNTTLTSEQKNIAIKNGGKWYLLSQPIHG